MAGQLLITYRSDYHLLSLNYSNMPLLSNTSCHWIFKSTLVYLFWMMDLCLLYVTHSNWILDRWVCIISPIFQGPILQACHSYFGRESSIACLLYVFVLTQDPPSLHTYCLLTHLMLTQCPPSLLIAYLACSLNVHSMSIPLAHLLLIYCTHSSNWVPSGDIGKLKEARTRNWLPYLICQ